MCFVKISDYHLAVFIIMLHMMIVELLCRILIFLWASHVHEVANKSTSIRAAWMTIHLILPSSDAVDAVMPLLQDAASAFMVCSNLRSTAFLLKGFFVLLIDKSLLPKKNHKPGWLISILSSFSRYRRTIIWVILGIEYVMHLIQTVSEEDNIICSDDTAK